MCILVVAAITTTVLVEAAPAAVPQARFVVPDQKVARETVERVYSTWRIGMMRANESAWRGATTKYRQMKVRNLILSQKGRFPDDFFHDQPEPPSLEKFRYIGCIAGCGNRSLAATYVGNVQLGNSKASENAFVLVFMYEDGKWKFDQSRMFNLEQLPDVRKRLHKGDLNILIEQDGFHPYDEAPKVPAACGYPQLIGKVFVDAPGRSIDMKINGVSVHEFEDERRADVISGGLRRGRNTISYTIRTNEKLAHPSMAIGLFVMPETPGNRPICVFDHILDARDVARGGEFTFDIANENIAAMNPRYAGAAPQPYHAVPLKQKTDKTGRK